MDGLRKRNHLDHQRRLHDDLDGVGDRRLRRHGAGRRGRLGWLRRLDHDDDLDDDLDLDLDDDLDVDLDVDLDLDLEQHLQHGDWHDVPGLHPLRRGLHHH